MLMEVAENPVLYRMISETVTAEEILEAAREIMDSRYAKGACFDSPEAGRHFFKYKLGDKPHEVFAVAFLDRKNRLLAYEELFRGSIAGASIHIREIAKRALFHNAGALILAHNHPSGCCLPSESDILITLKVSQAMEMFDVVVRDHFIVGKSCYSMAENNDI